MTPPSWHVHAEAMSRYTRADGQPNQRTSGAGKQHLIHVFLHSTQVLDLDTGAVQHTLTGVCVWSIKQHCLSASAHPPIGHTTQDEEPVTALAWAPDGKHLHTASRSLQQKVWDIATGKVIRTWRV